MFVNNEVLAIILGGGQGTRLFPLTQLRFRALVEVLLGTGARISEVLSLNRSDIHWERKEAKIVGKGNKERMLYFTDRALLWLERYLSRRWDEEEALFPLLLRHVESQPAPLREARVQHL